MPRKLTGRVSRLPEGFTEGRANVGGVSVNYKVGGRGPVVVLLHGYTQTSHMWTPLMPLLATSHTVIAPDLRGAGGSERTRDGYDKKTRAKDIRGLVHQLGYKQVQMVGHDIGLMVTYAYAAQYPAEVSKVVLMDASATKLDMPFLVLTGEKASGTFLIDQAKMVATNVAGTVVKNSGHWLMEEATDQVVPAIVAFLK